MAFIIQVNLPKKCLDMGIAKQLTKVKASLLIKLTANL